MRGIIARKYVENLRSEEMEFLGMTTRKKTAEEERNDPIKKMQQQMNERKNIQEGNWRTYLTQKDQLKEEIDENQGVDIQEGMLKDRRDWITETKEKNNNKIPDDIKGFHDRFKVEDALSPEEEEAKAAAEAEGGGKKGKKEAKKEKEKRRKERRAVVAMMVTLLSSRLVPLKSFKSSTSTTMLTTKSGFQEMKLTTTSSNMTLNSQNKKSCQSLKRSIKSKLMI